MGGTHQDLGGEFGHRMWEARGVCDLQDLLLWHGALGEGISAILPPCDPRPNPLALGELVIASLFSQRAVAAVDRSSGDLRWRAKLDGLGGSAVLSVGGLLYATTAHSVSALDPATGDLRWQWCPYGTGNERIYSLPALAPGRLFIGDRRGVLHCLSAAGGDVMWSVQTSGADKGSINATAAVVDETVLIATDAAQLVALDAASGAERWRLHLDGPSARALQRWRDLVLVQTRQFVYAIDPERATIRHSWGGASRVIRSFLALESGVLIHDTEGVDRSRAAPAMPVGTLRLVDDKDVRFQRPWSGDWRWFRYAASTGFIYEAGHGGLGMVDPATGRRVWAILARGVGGTGIPDIADGVIYLLADRMDLDRLRRREPDRAHSAVLLAVRHPLETGPEPHSMAMGETHRPDATGSR